MLKRILPLLLLLTVPLLANKEVSISVRPAQLTVQSPATQVKIIVEQNPKNRHLWLIWGVAGMEERSYFQLDGDEAPRTFYKTIKIRNLGENEVKAVVIRNDESVITDTAIVRLN